MLENNSKNNKTAAAILTTFVGIVALAGFIAAEVSYKTEDPGNMLRGVGGLFLDVISIAIALIFVLLLIKFGFYPHFFSTSSNSPETLRWKKLILWAVLLAAVLIGIISYLTRS
jgi:hypothetical protein